MSRGCTLINRDGIRFLEQQYSADMQLRLPRSEILRAVVREIQGNRGPVFIECSRLSEEVWAEFETSVGKPILEKIKAAGQDYRNDPIELVPAAHSVLIGIVTSPDTHTTVDGLWAAGECATGIHGAARVSGNGLGACLVYGDTAGLNAARSALADGKERNLPPIDSHSKSNESIADDQHSAYFAAIRDQLNDLAERALGIVRESQSLEEAIRKFDAIVDEFRDVSRNENSYGAVELSHLALVGGIMAKAAAARTESRGLHYRSDFPATDPEWQKWLILRRGNAIGELIWSTRANFSKSTVHP